jgi:hypothetical protein
MMTDLQKIIEKLQKSGRLTSNCQDDLDTFLFQYIHLVWKIENNKLIKKDRELIIGLLHMLYDINLSNL